MTSPTIAYRVGWLIDGTGNPAVEKRIVVIKGSRIRTILAPNDPQPPEMTIVDLSDCTMLPALIDSHVHLNRETMRHRLHRFGIDLGIFGQQDTQRGGAVCGAGRGPCEFVRFKHAALLEQCG